MKQETVITDVILDLVDLIDGFVVYGQSLPMDFLI